jgi:DNA-binding NarL/FixJ family response regulator
MMRALFVLMLLRGVSLGKNALGLTEREKLILRYNSRGYSDYRIGRELRVTVETVGRSRRNALKKLERAEADLAFARKIGLNRS